MQQGPIVPQSASIAGHSENTASVCSEQIERREGAILAEQGGMIDRLLVVESGWAIRSRRSSDGRSAITGVYLPGDLCDPLWLSAAPIQSVIAATPIRASAVPCETLREEMEKRTRIARAIWSEVAAGNETAAEWAVLLAARSAVERVGHVLCEIYTRLQQRRRASGGLCEFLLSSAQIADLTGLTPVHVERTLRDLQGLRLIAPIKRCLHILDMERLSRIAAFNPDYLGAPVDWCKTLNLPS